MYLAECQSLPDFADQGSSSEAINKGKRCDRCWRGHRQRGASIHCCAAVLPGLARQGLLPAAYPAEACLSLSAVEAGCEGRRLREGAPLSWHFMCRHCLQDYISVCYMHDSVCANTDGTWGTVIGIASGTEDSALCKYVGAQRNTAVQCNVYSACVEK
jgi:hypothetical protein